MSSIGPISSIAPQSIGLGSPSAKPATQQAPGASGFSDLLKTAMHQVDGDQQKSAGAIQDLLSGTSQDVLPVISAAAKADMSFKLLIGVRNKVIEAYKQTMNMQI